MNKKLLEYFYGYITENKKQLMDQVLSNRTRHLAVVLEDIYQPQNASAIVRTCDCYGVQDIHVIENKNKYNVNPHVALGASKWVDIIKYGRSENNNTVKCFEALKAKGYKVIAATPHENEFTIDELPIDQKTALVFGTEKEGLSEEAISMADGFVKIPMVGFTESLNISVCAAIFIYNLSNKIRSSDIDWQLTEDEKDEIKLRWVKKIIKRSYLLEKNFLEKIQE